MLELRGAFAKNPQRRRADSEGAAPFNSEPPQHLPQECVRAWTYIVERLPRVTIYSTDEIAVEISARLLATYWMSGDMAALKELRRWLADIGFSPVARTKLPALEPPRPENRFARLRDMGDSDD